MRVLVFGDSIAQGFWDIEGGWVARLRKYYDRLQLEDLRNRDEPTVFNLGVSGGTSKTILARFDAEVMARKNREELAIVISTGVNDSYVEGRDRFKSSPDEYEKNLQELAEKAKNYSQKIMFVGLVSVDEAQTTPVFWRDISYFNDRIKSYEDVMRKVAKENSLSFIPIHNRFKDQFSTGQKLHADGAHPNDQGHQLIFELVQPPLDELLNT